MKTIKTGQTFGMLEVISLETSIMTSHGKPSRAYVICRCVCGKIKIIRKGRLFKGDSKTCGEKECKWKGFQSTMQKKGRKYGLTKDGYIRVRVGSGSRAQTVLAHRLIMERSLGRKLKSAEVIHHYNGIKTDNRIENLEVLTISAHSKKHFETFAEIALLRKKVEELELRVKQLEYEKTRIAVAS